MASSRSFGRAAEQDSRAADRNSVRQQARATRASRQPSTTVQWLQRTLGNSGMSRLAAVQREAESAEEEEEQVQTSRTMPSIQREAEEEEEVQTSRTMPSMQREAEAAEEEEEQVQTSRAGGAVQDQDQDQDALGSQIRAASSGGTSLDPGIQRTLESGLGADLSGVRVHTDAEADHLSRSVNAVAFTTGQNIFFRTGAYDPSSEQGMHLLAHEATHTVQQAAGPVAGTPADGGVSISDPGDRYERAAESTATQMSTNQQVAG